MIESNRKKLQRGLEDLSKLFVKPREEEKQLEEAWRKPGMARVTALWNVLSCQYSIEETERLLTHAYGSEYRLSHVILQGGRAVERESQFRIDLRGLAHKGEKLDAARYVWPSAEIMACLDAKSRIQEEIRLKGHMIWLNVDLPEATFSRKLLAILDSLILVVQPKPESVFATYQFLKNVRQYRYDLDYGICFSGFSSHQTEEGFFEELSHLSSKYLNSPLYYLGSLERPGEEKGQNLKLWEESFLDLSDLRRPQPEKIRFLDYYQRHLLWSIRP
ncbi:MAG: MinD/ParA family ATP-binding protein [Candidatus Omnitrophota bacterium]